MLKGPLDLAGAFDAALAEVRKASRRGMVTASGSSAESKLSTLETALTEERQRALERGSVDRAWFQSTMRWLVDWLPETELTLIAALGKIARANPRLP